MKKLLLAFAILGFVACGGNETETTPAADTTAVAVDTAAAIVDTTTAVDTTAAAPAADTTKK
ncbi:MAG: entericidin [Bacteroidetes bacterium]|nr:entericidin [Bacteroidota bacterium]